MAGSIALQWGNEYFDRPPFDFSSFVEGVTLHDLGHGFFDSNEIGALSEEHAEEVNRRLVSVDLEDPISNAVAHVHILRLLGYGKQLPELVDICEKKITAACVMSGIDRGAFEWADRITAFCDFLSFDYCFDRQVERRIQIFPRVGDEESVEIRYEYVGGHYLHRSLAI